jgi:hypothetical protein
LDIPSYLLKRCSLQRTQQDRRRLQLIPIVFSYSYYGTPILYSKQQANKHGTRKTQEVRRNSWAAAARRRGVDKQYLVLSSTLLFTVVNYFIYVYSWHVRGAQASKNLSLTAHFL